MPSRPRAQTAPCTRAGSASLSRRRGGSGPFGLTIHGQDYVTHSTNWGRTWSRPVETMGSDGQRFVTGDPVDTFDRPWLAVDQSTGTVYAAGHNLANHEGWVTASTNKAASFGAIYPIDSPTYPSEGFSSSNIVAAHGVLAEAYESLQAPGHACPCLIFETSTDHGDGAGVIAVMPLDLTWVDQYPSLRSTTLTRFCPVTYRARFS